VLGLFAKSSVAVGSLSLLLGFHFVNLFIDRFIWATREFVYRHGNISDGEARTSSPAILRVPTQY